MTHLHVCELWKFLLYHSRKNPAFGTACHIHLNFEPLWILMYSIFTILYYSSVTFTPYWYWVIFSCPCIAPRQGSWSVSWNWISVYEVRPLLSVTSNARLMIGGKLNFEWWWWEMILGILPGCCGTFLCKQFCPLVPYKTYCDWNKTTLLWQKEASAKSDISCKRAKCVYHFHWC